MTQNADPDRSEQALAEQIDDMVPSQGYRKVPVVGLGGSAGSIEALQGFFSAIPAQTGLAFVVIIHLAPDHESMLAELLQRCTRMPVVQVRERLQVAPGTVYVIPPGRLLQLADGHLQLSEATGARGRNVAVDIFFRTLADTHGPHAAAVILSGLDGDGAIGIKRIKERGGLTVAQDPDEAAHPGMPSAAIATGTVDWILPVQDMPARLLSYFRMEQAITLPIKEDAPASPAPESQEAQLRDVLGLLRTRTGRDFADYKRGTVLRRIGRRMQVNGVDNLPAYLTCLRTRPGECEALLQDLLISVTNFFRDPECFEALRAELPALFAGKRPQDTVRVWVPACATGEEAFSVAMLLAEHTAQLESPPLVQVFASDLDKEAVATAREAVYPMAIEADVSEERLRRFFQKEHRGWRVRRELREMVLFAVHDVLRDSPFSRLDLVCCRNLMIYLNREAQGQLLQTLQFALVPHGRLFLGASESVEEASPLFEVVDKKHRLYRQRPTARAGSALPGLPSMLGLTLPGYGRREPALPAGTAFLPAPGLETARQREPMPAGKISWSEVHLRMLEQLGPPSLLADERHDILHLSPGAGRFLQMGGGEPSRNLLRSVHPDLRLELRGALAQAAQGGRPVELGPVPLQVGDHALPTSVRVVPFQEDGQDLYLVTFSSDKAGDGEHADPAMRLAPDPLARHLDREIERLKNQLRETVEQYEASTEELKASNEELQAMNEELRAATEELETSREELQSINEELSTVNYELKSKVDQLSHANSDMQNLMDATDIATIFLDRELRITRYTPRAVDLFHLIPGDVGRPLTDMATQLDYPELGADARRVLERLVPVEREVGRSGEHWYLARLMPYRTADDRIGGVVFTFIDISERKQAEEVRLWLSTVVTSTSDAIISFALDETILSWNSGAERIFGYTAAEAIGQPLGMLAADGTADRQDILQEVRAGRSIEHLETVRRRKDGETIHVALTISPVRDAAGQVLAGTALGRDVSAARAAAEALRQSEERLRLVVENVVEYAIFSTDLERRITVWNAGAQRILGYDAQEALGRSADMIFLPEDRAAGGPEREAETALREGRAADERTHLRKDGSRFRGSGVMMAMRDGSGEPVGFVKVVRDLSRHPPQP